MQIEYVNIFLYSLSIALINSIWQMAILWVIYQISTTINNVPSRVKYSLLIVLQVLGFVWFIVTFLNFYSSPYQTNILDVYFNKFPFITEKILPLISVGYIFYGTIVAFNFSQNYFSVQKLVKNEFFEVSEKWIYFVNTLSEKLEINKSIIIKVSKNISSPLTIGIFKPIILIPFASMNSLSVEQMEVVIIHELAHIKRQDYFINLLLIVIDVFMFFNPFSTSIKKQIVLERELCCDDVVIRENYSSRVYAQALLNIAKLQLNTCNNNISIYAVSSKKELKYRVNRILGLESKKYQSSFYKIFAALFIGTSFFFLQFHVPFKSEKIEWKINNVAKFQFAKNTFENKKIDNSTNRIVKQKSIKVKPGTKNNLELAYTKTELFKAEKKEMIESLVALGKAENKNNFEFILNQETNSNLEELRKSENNNTIEIISAVEKYPIITTQKFFIPATSSSAASIIIVTTSENEKGNKTVKIEIAKGSSRIE